MPEHDDALDAVAEALGGEQLAVGEHEVRAEVRAARDLGEQRSAESRAASSATSPAREPAMTTVAGPGAIGRRHHGRLGREPRAGHDIRKLDGAGERLAEGEVHVARAGDARRAPRGRAGPAGRPPSPVGAGTSQLCGATPAKMPDWHGGLVGADPAQLVGPVGAQHDERHPRVRRLEHGGVQVGDGGSGCRDDHHGRARLDREAEREESGRALVDAHVQPQQPGGLEPRRREPSACEREPGLSTRSRTPRRRNSASSAVAKELAGDDCRSAPQGLGSSSSSSARRSSSSRMRCSCSLSRLSWFRNAGSSSGATGPVAA